MPRKMNLVASRAAVRMNVLEAASTGVWRVDLRVVAGARVAGAQQVIEELVTALVLRRACGDGVLALRVAGHGLCRQFFKVASEFDAHLVLGLVQAAAGVVVG